MTSRGARSKYSPPGLDVVHATHAQLMQLADTLNERIAIVLSAQEGEFLHAYRGHTYALQTEMQALRVAASGSLASQARDERVRVLEAERNWLREESTRLTNVVTANAAELAATSAKLNKVHTEAAWLDERVREAVRTEARLRAALAATAGGDVKGAGSTAPLASPTPTQRAPLGPATLLALSPARRSQLLVATGRGAKGAGVDAAAAATAATAPEGVTGGEGEALVRAQARQMEELRAEAAALRAERDELARQLLQAREEASMASVADGGATPDLLDTGIMAEAEPEDAPIRVKHPLLIGLKASRLNPAA